MQQGLKKQATSNGVHGAGLHHAQHWWLKKTTNRDCAKCSKGSKRAPTKRGLHHVQHQGCQNEHRQKEGCSIRSKGSKKRSNIKRSAQRRAAACAAMAQNEPQEIWTAPCAARGQNEKRQKDGCTARSSKGAKRNEGCWLHCSQKQWRKTERQSNRAAPQVAARAQNDNRQRGGCSARCSKGAKQNDKMVGLHRR